MSRWKTTAVADGPANNDPTGDDCFVFIVSLDGIERIVRVRVD